MIRDFAVAGRLPTQWPESGGTAVPGRDAATVMLVRDAPPGVEVFAFRRVPRMAFAAGMLVFPGGGVDPRDLDPAVPWTGTPATDLAPRLGATADAARALVVAAVRETFEECGILPAVRPGGPAGAAQPAEEQRQALEAGDVSLAEVLREAGLVLDADLLLPWAHWVTPGFESRRFDTRFFLAVPPPGAQPRDLHAEGLGGEGERAGWLLAADAVRRHGRGQLPMLPPTLVCLEELAAAPDVATLLATPRRLRPVSPWLHHDPAGDEDPVLRVDLDGAGGGEPGP